MLGILEFLEVFEVVLADERLVVKGDEVRAGTSALSLGTEELDVVCRRKVNKPVDEVFLGVEVRELVEGW